MGVSTVDAIGGPRPFSARQYQSLSSQKKSIRPCLVSNFFKILVP